jgi:pre-mRNA cleavage complex 2 protein Pcf11
VPPWIKLPAFYLLDMISKNIYDPYARLFSGFITPLFLESYHQVDDATRKKMDELVITWRTGAPSGKELFGLHAQRSIEHGIWGNSASGSSVRGRRSKRNDARRRRISQFNGSISEGQVISELEFTLGQKERHLQSNPYDSTTRNQISILQQVFSFIFSFRAAY